MKKNEKGAMSQRQAFFKAMIYTLAAVSLILIGYFTANYFFSGI